MRLLVLTILLLSALCAVSQVNSAYNFWKDDSVLRDKFHQATIAKKQFHLRDSEKKQYAKDLKTVYEGHFENIGHLWKSKSTVTAQEPHAYLQSVVKRIVDANPELKGTDARIVFTRDDWPNAVSMGDGTIVVNAGLMIYLANEAELVFVICHELAHYYLDHSNKTIGQLVETYNSEEFKKEIKRLSKEQYGVGQQLENLMKKMAFGSRRHSRDHEAEADRQAFLFMKNTGYDCSGIETCLQLLNHVDDTSLYKPFVPETIFHFEQYPFKKKWVEKTSSIFAQMNHNESPLTPQEKDSLRTHPDCEKRIELLKDSISKVAGGKQFLVNEIYFNQLKKEFFLEMSEHVFREDNLARNLYYNLQMLQQGENIQLAVYSIARNLNILYERQKRHRLGDIDKESRFYDADYNLLLRMIDRWKLDDIAFVNYLFCRKYEETMKGNESFAKEMKKAQQNMLEQKSN